MCSEGPCTASKFFDEAKTPDGLEKLGMKDGGFRGV